jgi:hypothetical protein
MLQGSLVAQIQWIQLARLRCKAIMVMVALERMPAGSILDLGCGELKLQVFPGVSGVY